MKKAKEDSEKIESALQLFKSFVKNEKDEFDSVLLQMLNNDYAYKNSFDLYHVAFSNAYGCEKLITFDKGFKKFIDICEIDIEVLTRSHRLGGNAYES